MKKIDSTAEQRRADQGDGTYLNPIVPGDHPDPSILKDGADYYMIFSSFLAYPGIVIWHSADLISWHPVCAALHKPVGSVWASDLVKYRNRYYIYIPAIRGNYISIYVIHADNINGPWSDPIDLKLESCIDPAHVVGEDGKRYLFVNGIRMAALSGDGLSVIGRPEHAYKPWQYPDNWVVEMFAPEGPKFARRGRYFYLISAVGGTAGPPTSHMVIVARSESIKGPWEDCPFNPVIHTVHESEPWWSKGHASLVEGPSGDWWIVYHAYENGFRTLGRQTLLEPVTWTDDGWFRTEVSDLSKPIKKPGGGKPGTAGFILSDDFSENRMGIQWSFFNSCETELDRIQYKDNSLTMKGKGISPADCSPLTMIAGDRSYEVAVTLEPLDEAQGGLILFYNERMFCGIGFSRRMMFTYNYGEEHPWIRKECDVKSVRIQLININNVITYYYSINGESPVKHPWQMEVSGMHHNVFGGFSSLKPGLFSADKGRVRFTEFTYKRH